MPLYAKMLPPLSSDEVQYTVDCILRVYIKLTCTSWVQIKILHVAQGQALGCAQLLTLQLLKRLAVLCMLPLLFQSQILHQSSHLDIASFTSSYYTGTRRLIAPIMLTTA